MKGNQEPFTIPKSNYKTTTNQSKEALVRREALETYAEINEREEDDPLFELVLRCEITNNPCGTDTTRSGCLCLCDNCLKWLADNQEPLGEEFQRVLDEYYLELLGGE